ncbi:transcription factor with AP2 domain(s), putative [Plasmodium ovale]|uniref:Transcription factor with AP2 domain(S), putative n=2 Tax=Plasmodium ovale TaxID=36330 RepID=A0A1D3TMY0_PLAOA|nr:transcription factor with AP2 domain(s), putative (AP2-G2) [Plasmodium ovale curtisi]SBS97770.1 transcription factor with AP2 domain(s), putative (AP2-G2) [Plasmodium ovale curtisi]SCP06330.1 transcription factor with AP2 domain(s), putative [Plasmodium ovale]
MLKASGDLRDVCLDVIENVKKKNEKGKDPCDEGYCRMNESEKIKNVGEEIEVDEWIGRSDHNEEKSWRDDSAGAETETKEHLLVDHSGVACGRCDTPDSSPKHEGDICCANTPNLSSAKCENVEKEKLDGDQADQGIDAFMEDTNKGEDMGTCSHSYNETNYIYAEDVSNGKNVTSEEGQTEGLWGKHLHKSQTPMKSQEVKKLKEMRKAREQREAHSNCNDLWENDPWERGKMPYCDTSLPDIRNDERGGDRHEYEEKLSNSCRFFIYTSNPYNSDVRMIKENCLIIYQLLYKEKKKWCSLYICTNNGPMSNFHYHLYKILCSKEDIYTYFFLLKKFIFSSYIYFNLVSIKIFSSFGNRGDSFMFYDISQIVNQKGMVERGDHEAQEHSQEKKQSLSSQEGKSPSTEVITGNSCGDGTGDSSGKVSPFIPNGTLTCEYTKELNSLLSGDISLSGSSPRRDDIPPNSSHVGLYDLYNESNRREEEQILNFIYDPCKHLYEKNVNVYSSYFNFFDKDQSDVKRKLQLFINTHSPTMINITKRWNSFYLNKKKITSFVEKYKNITFSSFDNFKKDSTEKFINTFVETFSEGIGQDGEHRKWGDDFQCEGSHIEVSHYEKLKVEEYVKGGQDEEGSMCLTGVESNSTASVYPSKGDIDRQLSTKEVSPFSNMTEGGLHVDVEVRKNYSVSVELGYNNNSSLINDQVLNKESNIIPLEDRKHCETSNVLDDRCFKLKKGEKQEAEKQQKEEKQQEEKQQEEKQQEEKQQEEKQQEEKQQEEKQQEEEKQKEEEKQNEEEGRVVGNSYEGGNTAESGSSVVTTTYGGSDNVVAESSPVWGVHEKEGNCDQGENIHYQKGDKYEGKKGVPFPRSYGKISKEKNDLEQNSLSTKCLTNNIILNSLNILITDLNELYDYLENSRTLQVEEKGGGGTAIFIADNTNQGYDQSHIGRRSIPAVGENGMLFQPREEEPEETSNEIPGELKNDGRWTNYGVCTADNRYDDHRNRHDSGEEGDQGDDMQNAETSSVDFKSFCSVCSGIQYDTFESNFSYPDSNSYKKIEVFMKESDFFCNCNCNHVSNSQNGTENAGVNAGVNAGANADFNVGMDGTVPSGVGAREIGVTGVVGIDGHYNYDFFFNGDMTNEEYCMLRKNGIEKMNRTIDEIIYMNQGKNVMDDEENRDANETPVSTIRVGRKVGKIDMRNKGIGKNKNKIWLQSGKDGESKSVTNRELRTLRRNKLMKSSDLEQKSKSIKTYGSNYDIKSPRVKKLEKFTSVDQEELREVFGPTGVSGVYFEKSRSSWTAQYKVSGGKRRAKRFLVTKNMTYEEIENVKQQCIAYRKQMEKEYIKEFLNEEKKRPNGGPHGPGKKGKRKRRMKSFYDS